MRLLNFSITKYRSITTAHKIKISDLTVLIGKNNEGKSNILKALNVAMNTLQEHAHGRAGRPYTFGLAKAEEIYYWERDFPIELQNRSRNKESVFRLEFELNSEEMIEFRQAVKSQLNGTLPLEIKFGRENKPTITVPKQGRGGNKLSNKSGRIAQFIADKIYFNYIPAIRTDQEAINEIRHLLSYELSVLEENEEYKRALLTITDLQTPLLENLANKIKVPLSEFLPNIQGVTIEISEVRRLTALRRDIDVYIDDGFLTKIEYKGDGVKSLATLALLKNKYMVGGASIIAIEEPESHLHPSAIHQLKSIIIDLSRSNQIIISSHNPLFVDRHEISANIIIDNRKAKAAKTITEIRELLGVQASDNLVNATYVLVVEGEEDVTSLSALLPILSNKLANAVKNHVLVFDPLNGAGNLSYKLSLLSNALCVYHVFLDCDEAGRKAYERAEKDGWLSVKKCTFVTCDGMKESEFEDTLEPDVYIKAVMDEFGVDLSVSKFRSSAKWSDRANAVFRQQGKLWTDNVQAKLKRVVAQSVRKSPDKALNPHKRNSLDNLVRNLETLIAGKHNE
jgi:predicted ATPase